MTRTAIVWLRRDLRLRDNVALAEAALSGAALLVLYVIDDAILGSTRVSAARVGFMCDALNGLDEDLHAYGARLIVRRGRPARVVADFAREAAAEAVYVNRDYTPYSRKRDREVQEALGRIPLKQYHDRLLVAPDEIQTGSGGIYTVFTPFKNKWRSMPKRQPEPVEASHSGAFHDPKQFGTLSIPTAESLGFRPHVPIPPASHDAANARLTSFTSDRILKYKDRRNVLADPFDDPRCGTSSLSPYIRWGLVSLRQIRAAAADAYQLAEDDEGRESVTGWMDELIWHEFYTHILWHFPHVKTRNFSAKYDAVSWRKSPDEFDAWAAGQTGYPVVDAAMRQLAATGWMHNRARMIVASFLTKSLLIDWREGELFFMRNLLDGDLAANNGGWQWAAGTGTDAQPYFRIFNPVTQSEKFDVGGTFIRRWVPELRHLPDAAIHAPWMAGESPRRYPPPIVDHGFARERALAAFEVVKS